MIEPTKIDRVLLIVLAITNLVVIVIVAILIFWTLKLNQIRLSEDANQYRFNQDQLKAIQSLSAKPKIDNHGSIAVLGNMAVK